MKITEVKAVRDHTRSHGVCVPGPFEYSVGVEMSDGTTDSIEVGEHVADRVMSLLAQESGKRLVNVMVRYDASVHRWRAYHPEMHDSFTGCTAQAAIDALQAARARKHGW